MRNSETYVNIETSSCSSARTFLSASFLSSSLRLLYAIRIRRLMVSLLLLSRNEMRIDSIRQGNQKHTHGSAGSVWHDRLPVSPLWYDTVLGVPYLKCWLRLKRRWGQIEAIARTCHWTFIGPPLDLYSIRGHIDFCYVQDCAQAMWWCRVSEPAKKMAENGEATMQQLQSTSRGCTTSTDICKALAQFRDSLDFYFRKLTEGPGKIPRVRRDQCDTV